MPNLNVCHLMGNLTRDPELRVTPKGTAICQFGIAVNRTFKGEDGSQRDEVTFLDVEAWGKQGETVAKFLTKGKPIYIQGRLKLEQWDDKASGAKRSKIKIVLEQFQFIGGRDPGADEPGAVGRHDDAPTEERRPPTQQQRPTPGQQPRPSSPPPRPPASNMDEDVPF